MRGEEEKRRKMKGKVSTLFALMAVIMITIAMSATASADTGIVRPNGDVTTGWAGSTGTDHYTEVDDAVTEPTAGDTADYVFTGTAGSGNEVEEFDMGTISGVESVSNVKAWMYAKSDAGNGGQCDEVDMNVYMGGAYQIAQPKAMTTTWTWHSASFDGSWTQADLDALKVKLTRNVAGGGNPALKDDNVRVATVYVDVTYTPAYAHTTKITVSCDPTDFKRCESTNITGYLTSEGVGFGGKTVNLSFRAASQYDAAYDMIDPDDPDWHQFASVTTESNGFYNYSWNPADENPRYAGWHAIKASFDGEGLEYSPSANTTGYSESPNLLLNFSTLYIDCYTKDHGGWPMFEVEKGTLKGDVFVAWNRTFSTNNYAKNQTWTLPHGTLKSAYYFYGEWGENGECIGGTHHLEINGENVIPLITGKDNVSFEGGDLKYQPGKHTCGCCVADCECPGCTDPSPRKDLWQKYNYSVGVSGCGASYIALNLTNAAGVINMGEPNNFKVVTGSTCRLYGCFLVVVYENSSLNYTQYWINQGYINLNADGQNCDCGHISQGSAMHSYTNFTGDLAGTVTNATLYHYGIIGHDSLTDIVELNGYEVTTDTGRYPVCVAYNVPTDNVTSNSQVHQYIPSETDDQNYRGNVWILKTEVEGIAAEEPSVTSYAPASPVNDTEGASRTFNITVDQIVNVSWQINGTEVQTNTSETEAFYTNTSATDGVWNVSAIVSNANGTDMQTWIWNVTGAPNVVLTVHNTSFGNVLAGDNTTIYLSLTLNNSEGTGPAEIEAVFTTNVGEIYGLNGTGANIIPGNYFELGPDGNEKPLANTMNTTIISTLLAGENVTYNAILIVPAGQAADDYSGIVELSW